MALIPKFIRRNLESSLIRQINAVGTGEVLLEFIESHSSSFTDLTEVGAIALQVQAYKLLDEEDTSVALRLHTALSPHAHRARKALRDIGIALSVTAQT